MKTQNITFGLLLIALSFTSCKNNEKVAAETPLTTNATLDTIKQTEQTAVKDSLIKEEKTNEKGENEANEKNEKE